MTHPGIPQSTANGTEMPGCGVGRSVWTKFLAAFLGVPLLLAWAAHFSRVCAAQGPTPATAEEVHPYHDGPPRGPLPHVVDAKEFNNVVVQHAYRLAAKLPAVLYQQPCYCHCGRYLGHKSLLDCFTSKHTAGCPICLQELFYIHDETLRGRTPAEIRAGLERGEWKAVELDARKFSPLRHPEKVEAGTRPAWKEPLE
jgi:hypothetical protein